MCLQNASGEYVMDYSGHVTADPGLLNVLVNKLKRAPGDVAGVGCSNVSPSHQSLVGALSGVAFQSLLGGGGVFMQNRRYPDDREVEHVSFCLYRKTVLEDVGGFDTRFWCGQDAELDIRLRKKGYKILYTPDTRVYHYKRQTLRGLFVQMYRYGAARARIILKHPDSFKLFYLMGVFFVSGVFMLPVLLLSELINFELFILFVLLYICLCWFSVVDRSRRMLFIPLAPLVFFVIHSGYGLGFLRGVLWRR